MGQKFETDYCVSPIPINNDIVRKFLLRKRFGKGWKFTQQNGKPCVEPKWVGGLVWPPKDSIFLSPEEAAMCILTGTYNGKPLY